MQTLFPFELALREIHQEVSRVLFACVRCVDWCFVSGHRGAIFGGACVGVRERKHLLSKKYTKNRWALLRMTARLGDIQQE
jgi:hypothetical protein